MRCAVAFQANPVLLDRPDRGGQLYADGGLGAARWRCPSETWLGWFSSRFWPVGALRLSSVPVWTRPARGSDAS